MNPELLRFFKRLSELATHLPIEDAEELFAAIIEYAGEAPEAMQIAHAAMLLHESRAQLKLFAAS
jgi:hypothetical protein